MLSEVYPIACALAVAELQSFSKDTLLKTNHHIPEGIHHQKAFVSSLVPRVRCGTAGK
jgi:adenosylmethionine-8-amino-7-oxononanoate aminotransferase